MEYKIFVRSANDKEVSEVRTTSRKLAEALLNEIMSHYSEWDELDIRSSHRPPSQKKWFGDKSISTDVIFTITNTWGAWK